MSPRTLSIVLIAAACGGVQHPAPTPGAVAGLVRDATTGSGVAGARIVLRRPGTIDPIHADTNGDGAYMLVDLPAGWYHVAAFLHEAPIGTRDIEVANGRLTGLDFAVGPRASEAAAALDEPSRRPLWRYHPRTADPDTGVIEGTVADLYQRGRVAGAVVTVVRDGHVDAVQAITDDTGRFRIEGLGPGSYAVSAYYAVVRRAQVEVRRNRVEVGGGEVVVVPLWLDTNGM